MFILEGFQKTPSVNNIFSILYAILDGPKFQHQIVDATDLARQTVAETLVPMFEHNMITITPGPYHGAVDETKLVGITEQGRKTYEGLEPWMNKMFPNWRSQIGQTRADRLGRFPVD
jgi:DNA-binding HxlR family transcriptional regulator